VAVAIVAVATLARLGFLQVLGTRATYITLYPAVTIAAVYGGLPAGLLATVLSAIVADYFWLEPAGFGIFHPADWLSMAIFLASGTLISCVSEAMHRAQARARGAEGEAGLAAARQGEAKVLREARDELELRVQERTEELAKTTEALRFERQRFRDVLDVLPAYVVLLAPDYHVPFANRFFEERFGVSHGRRCYEYLFGRTEPCETCETYTALKTMAPHRWEWTGPDGRNYDIYDFPFTDSDGSTLILEMGLDITERKQAEAELMQHRHHLEELVQERTGQLAAAHAQMEAVVRHLDEGVVLADIEGRMLQWNPAATAMHGFASLEEAQRRLVEFTEVFELSTMDGTVLPVDQWPLARILRGENLHDWEVRVRRLQGDWQRIFSYGGTLVRDAQGQPFLALVTLSDVTERKRAEEQLRRAAEELARSNKDLEQFAYVASHDLQEPLRMVTGYMQLLSQRYKGRLDDQADTFIGYAVDGAQRMSTLIHDLLAYSRVSTQGKPLCPASAEEALDAALRNLRAAVEQERAAITRDPLPVVRADKAQLARLFQNLIGNAVKYRSPDRPAEIHVSACRERGQWVFTVRDNGIGFEQQYEDKVFMVFQRLHGRRKYPGTGIGLAICKRIVERHGGRIWATSEPGRGSVFHFTIPTDAASE